MLVALLLFVSLSSGQYLTYWHNWADSDGTTHFTQCNLTNNWKASAFGPGQTPIYVNTMNLSSTTTKLTWFFTPYQWKPAVFYHTNPVVQFAIYFVGSMRFESTDGTVVHIGGGDIYFGDDLGSKGHHSENVGYGPAVSAMIQFAGPVASGPCWPSKVDNWF